MKAIYEKLTAKSIYITIFLLARSKARQDCPLSSLPHNIFLTQTKTILYPFIPLTALSNTSQQFSTRSNLRYSFFLSFFLLPSSLPFLLPLGNIFPRARPLLQCGLAALQTCHPAISSKQSLPNSQNCLYSLLFYTQLPRSMPSVSLVYSFVFMEHILEYLRKTEQEVKFFRTCISKNVITLLWQLKKCVTQQHQHHQRTHQKCTFSHPTPDLLNQKLKDYSPAIACPWN